MSEIAILTGLDRVKFFPIEKNTSSEYSVGAGFDLPAIQEVSREIDSETKPLFADDKVYANVVNFKVIKATFTYVGTSFEDLEKLGFGTYDTTKKEFTSNPMGIGKEFVVSFRSRKLNGTYRMFKFFNFKISTVKESEIKTQGMSDPGAGIIIEGTFTGRVIDDKINVIKDSETPADYGWLNTVESLPTPPITTRGKGDN